MLKKYIKIGFQDISSVAIDTGDYQHTSTGSQIDKSLSLFQDASNPIWQFLAIF